MLISHSRRFIFIHIYKTAGSSIYRALYPYTRPPEESYWNWAMGKLKLLPTSGDFTAHIECPDLRQKLGAKMYDGYFKFAIVRNPLDWQASLYYFICQKPDHPKHLQFKQFANFEAFVRWRVTVPSRPQRRFILDENGKLMVDFVGRFEHLNTDFKTICDRIGIKAELPHINASKRDDYRKLYTTETEALMREYLKNDFDFIENLPH